MAKAQPEAVAPRSPEEVTEYNDRVWDMVLYKVHPVALYVLLQIILFSRFTGHPGLAGWGFAIFAVQFLAAWSVLQGTLLRDMGFRSFAPIGLVLWSLLGLALSFCFAEPLAWSVASCQVALFGYLAPMLLVWAFCLYRWRQLKRLYWLETGEES